MEDKEVFELAQRLNEIMVQRNELDMEYNEIVEKLWGKIPSLKEDVNIQKVRIKKKKGNNSNVK